jgi:phosphatidate phosphatase APP1
MPNWRQIISQLANSAEGGFDALKRRLDDRWGDEPVCIAAYRSYGTRDHLYLKGRILEEQRVRPASATDSAWRNLRNMYRRFESDEITGARVLARYGDAEQEAITDDDGYFKIRLDPGAVLPEGRLWHHVELTLVEPRVPGQSEVRAAAPVLVPPAGAHYGVISDIDDTVLQTDATSLVKMFRATFLRNARTRLPFPGVSALYRALQVGADAPDQLANPLFYVSSSPWNIYDMLEEFLAIQRIPAGPLMLRDWGFSSSESSPFRHREHKLQTIRGILDTYPALPFLLIGDSGQEDPEIYREVVQLYPGRILAIYIRNVSRASERVGAIQALAEQVAATGSTLILADDSLAAARHAAEQGWISAEGLAEVVAASAADQPAEPAPEAPTVIVEGQPAVDAGAVEQALKDGQGQQPPTVIVEGEKHKA